MKADIDFLKRLVRIPSVSTDAAANDRMADEVAHWLGERGVAARGTGTSRSASG